MSNRRHVRPASFTTSLNPSSNRTIDLSPPAPRTIRCAIYTHKSTEEGLQQAFNSLDAQREAAEAYVLSMKHEGWVLSPTRYDDGGYSGGNAERPGLKALMTDINAGQVDCVVVYKVDRLSRSLLDFARLMAVFEQHKVSFVSVTQQFNTACSMGRLTLNVLLSFAQFERELVSERTRDKLAAARRKGKFAGGRPLLGYDLHRDVRGPKLVVNEDEAAQVRTIYDLYLQHQALVPVVRDLHERGWKNKRYTNRAEQEVGGRPIDKATLYKLLTSRTYLGQVCYKDEVHKGEHEPIVDQATWDKVQAVLGRNGRTAGALVRNRYGALLKGILVCGSCGCSMGYTYACKGTKRYAYYVCLSAQKKGWDRCATRSVPAGEIERVVVEQVSRVGQDPAVLNATLRQLAGQQDQDRARLNADARSLGKEQNRHQQALKRAFETQDAQAIERSTEQLSITEQKLADVHDRLRRLEDEAVDPTDVSTALSAFTPLWEQLAPKERARVVRLLVERVAYDKVEGTVAVTFRPAGIKTLADGQRS